MDHVVFDVEIAKTIEETPGGWDATDKLGVAVNWDVVERRFCAKVDTDGPVIVVELGKCWTWVWAISSTGYGSVRVNKIGLSAHVLSFALANGYFPPSPLEIRHKCDNRACVNPDHLEIGTRADNIQDCVDRNRHGSVTHPESYRCGEQHHHGKKTCCPYGHEYTPDNVYIINNGASRACKKCMIARAKKHKANKRAELC